MRFRTKHRHMIDLLFPVALFFVFALSALTVLLIAARIYQSTTEHSSLHDTSRTSLSYISEKLHQSDEAGSVSLGTFDGCDALIIQQTHGEHTYYTYIYSYEGQLRELFVKAGVNTSASSGMAILEVQDFSMEELSDGLLKFSCTDQEGQTTSSMIGLRSR
ncbi:MAG: DUF4860 domain-containing protein [Lachnospiraceae bacterium]|jgi:hypothetical protein|nr:DUF4860 domain-containing protein [Lachnospiraceae bacterium]